MPLSERLADFAGALSSAVDAPDEYPFPEYVNFESNMADLRALWAEIRPQLVRDPDKAQLVDRKLTEMFAAFESGEKAKGRAAVMTIYNLKVETLQ